MIVTGAFKGPVEGESPMGTEKRFSSAKADTEMSAMIIMKISFLMYRSPLVRSHRMECVSNHKRIISGITHYLSIAKQNIIRPNTPLINLPYEYISEPGIRSADLQGYFFTATAILQKDGIFCA